MGHGRQESLRTDEAKAALLAWGRDADRAVGRRVAARPMMMLGGALAMGLVLSLALGGRKEPRGHRKGKCRC